jgi:hypothetical protein
MPRVKTHLRSSFNRAIDSCVLIVAIICSGLGHLSGERLDFVVDQPVGRDRSIMWIANHREALDKQVISMVHFLPTPEMMTIWSVTSNLNSIWRSRYLRSISNQPRQGQVCVFARFQDLENLACESYPFRSAAHSRFMEAVSQRLNLGPIRLEAFVQQDIDGESNEGKPKRKVGLSLCGSVERKVLLGDLGKTTSRLVSELGVDFLSLRIFDREKGPHWQSGCPLATLTRGIGRLKELPTPWAGKQCSVFGKEKVTCF